MPVNAGAELKKSEILAAAAELFSQLGYEGAGMRELARRSGGSLAGLYHYFPDKQALLYELQRETFEALLARARQALEAKAAPRARLRQFIHGHVEYFLRHRDAALVLVREDRSLTAERARHIAALKHAYYELARELTAVALDRQTRGPRLRALVLSLFGMLNWIPTWHHDGRDLDAAELAGLIAGIFEHGAASGAGSLHSEPSLGASKSVNGRVGQVFSSDIAGRSAGFRLGSAPGNDKTKQFRGNCIKPAGNSAGIAPGNARQP